MLCTWRSCRPRRAFSPTPSIRFFMRNACWAKHNFSGRKPFNSSPPVLPCRADSSRALGWDTPSQPSSSGSFFSRHSAGHLGYAGTSLWIDFERQVAIVLLTNRTWPHRQSQAIRTVRPAFHDAVMESLRSHRVNCHNPKVFAWMARDALISEQSIRHLEIKSFS